MAKQRKRTNSKVPAKGRLRDIADSLWSLAVRIDWAYRCAICDHRGNLNSHHLIPRQHTATRYDLQNGICLCKRCHQFCPKRSPHQHGEGFRQWLEVHHPHVAFWMRDNCHPEFLGTTDVQFYIDQILRLRQYVEPDDFERIVGVRFAAYLDREESSDE